MDYEELKRTIAIIKVRFNRGETWANIGKNFVYMIMGLYFFEDAIHRLGAALKPYKYFDLFAQSCLIYVNPFYLYWLLPILLVIVLYTLGYIDERWGFWKQENEYNTGTLNPHLRYISDGIRTLLERVK